MKNTEYGSVYFIKHKGLSPIKIGYSKKSNPKKRINHYKTASPYGVIHLGHIVVRNSKELESFLHEKYKNKRLNGEWFDILEDDVKKELSNYSNSEIHSQIKLVFTESWVKNNLNKKELKIDYRKEFKLLMPNQKFYTLSDFNQCLKKILTDNNYKVQSKSSNGIRYYLAKKL